MSIKSAATVSSTFELPEKSIRLFNDRSRYSYVEEPLEYLRTSNEVDWEQFLTPWGQQKVTLVHLAAHTGNLQMLERSVELDVDMNAVDEYQRSALHHAAFKGQLNIVRWLMDRPYGPDQLGLQNLDGDTAVHEAIRGLTFDSLRSPDSKWRNVAVVELLVRKGASVDTVNANGLPPLHLAGHNLSNFCDPNACKWYEKIVEIFVSASASVDLVIEQETGEGATPLHHSILLQSTEATRQLLKYGASITATDNFGNTPLHLAAGSDRHDLLYILLEKADSSMFHKENWFQHTPLHCAARTGHPKNFRAFIDRGVSLLSENSKGMTVLHFLFEYCTQPVDYLSDVFDSRVRLEDCSTRILLPNDQALILDFDVLLPPGRPQMDIVSTLIRATVNMEQMMILQHPLLETFLRLKWSSYRNFFFVFFTLHVLFLLFLFWYAAVIQKEVDSVLPRRLLLSCSFILLFHNVLELLTMARHYVGQFEHWLSLVCATLSIGVAVIGEILPNAMADTPLKISDHASYSWLRNSISIVILLAGIQVMFAIGRFPASGYYTLMFFSVLKNVLKVFLVFVCLIFSFAFSFLILLHGTDQFQDPWMAIVKTLVMMTGEFDYNVFLTATDQNNSTATSFNSGNTLLPFTRGTIFLLFVMLVNIVLTNLITALAVTDVQGLVEKGKLLRLMKQAEFTADFERMTTYWISSYYWVPKCLKKMLKYKIPDQILIPFERPKRKWLGAKPISENMIKKLHTLAEKNRDSDKKSRMDSSSKKPEGANAEVVLYLQKQIRELELKNMDLLERIQYSNLRNARSEGDVTTAL